VLNPLIPSKSSHPQGSRLRTSRRVPVLCSRHFGNNPSAMACLFCYGHTWGSAAKTGSAFRPHIRSGHFGRRNNWPTAASSSRNGIVTPGRRVRKVPEKRTHRRMQGVQKKKAARSDRASYPLIFDLCISPADSPARCDWVSHRADLCRRRTHFSEVLRGFPLRGNTSNPM